MVFPYLCVDLSISEQVEHLSAAAHLALGLYRLSKKDFIPTNLYIDLMIMIKNVLFSIAKAKVDDPNGCLCIILLGTDRLEELFGILRTMVSNDANLDILQLVYRLSGTTEVSNILAKYPHWDKPPRRLTLPALTRESATIPDSADHIKPASWRGSVKVSTISLQTSWSRRRKLAEEDCDFLSSILKGLNDTPGVDILAPFGTLLVKVPIPSDDVDESLENTFPGGLHPLHPVDSASAPDDIRPRTECRIEVEDELLEIAVSEEATVAESNPDVSIISRTLTVNGKNASKSRLPLLMPGLAGEPEN
jgi:hypothetical protein